MRKFSITLLLFLITFSLNAFSADNSQKYVQISNQKQTESDKIIVNELFWYGCPHSYNIEPTIDKIEANLDKATILIKIPVALRDSWLNHAKAFYVLQQMKLDDNLHEPIFHEIHINGNRLDTKDKLSNFVSDQGYDGESFANLFDSFGTEIRVNKASRLAKQYQIDSVPTLIVNGKYSTSGSFVSSYDELYNVVNLLIDKERVN